MSALPEGRQRAAAGFTLLELLVALGLFALVAAMAYGGLMSVLNTRAGIEKRLDRTAAYQKAYWILRNDFQNGVDRPIRGNLGELEPALKYTPINHEVDFTRGGWANPLRLPRSTLRRLGYFWDVDKKALMRRTWPVLDRAPQTNPVDTVLLSGVDEIQWRFLDDNNEWRDHWPTRQANLSNFDIQPPAGQANVLQRSAAPPRVVKLVLDTHDWGKLTFLFPYGLPNPAGRTSQVPNPAATGGAGNVFSNPPAGVTLPGQGSGTPRSIP